MRKKVFRGTVKLHSQYFSVNQDEAIDEEEAITIIEEKASGLLDTLCECNRDFLRVGMKIGASLIFQLL